MSNVYLLLILLLIGVPASANEEVPKNGIISEHTGKKHTVEGSAAQSAKPQVSNNKIKVYKYSNKGTASFSDRPPRGQAYEVLTYHCFACDVNSQIDWYAIKIYPKKYADLIRHASRHYSVDPALIRAVIHAESAFRPTIKSRKGAVGLMQLMPATASDMGVDDRTDPAQNIYGGTKYLAWLLQLFSGDRELATAAYNAGPGAVKRHGGVPPYPETEAYIKRVAILAERYGKAK